MSAAGERLRVLLVDDEPLARTRLRRLLSRRPGIDIVGEAHDGTSFLAALDRLNPTLVFLDVEMPGMNGLDALALRPSTTSVSIVFVTAHDRYAAEAFRYEAVHYLLKPVTRDALSEAIERVRRRRQGTNGAASELHEAIRALEHRQRLLEGRSGSEEVRYLDRFLVKFQGAEFPVAAREVDALEAQGNYVALHTANGRHLVRGTLQGVEQSLDPRRFVRIHRGTVINLDRVQQVQPWFWGDSMIITARGHKYRMSRRYRAGFYERFRASGGRGS